MYWSDVSGNIGGRDSKAHPAIKATRKLQERPGAPPDNQTRKTKADDNKNQKKLLKLMHKFSNVEGYKVNKQKLIVFQYTSNEQSYREIKKTVLFRIS